MPKKLKNVIGAETESESASPSEGLEEVRQAAFTVFIGYCYQLLSQKGSELNPEEANPYMHKSPEADMKKIEEFTLEVIKKHFHLLKGKKMNEKGSDSIEKIEQCVTTTGNKMEYNEFLQVLKKLSEYMESEHFVTWLEFLPEDQFKALYDIGIVIEFELLP